MRIRECSQEGRVRERKDHDIAFRGAAGTADGLNVDKEVVS
jgi:hypothetical protein